MVPQYIIRLLAVAAVASAAPLNINLGAYSPALVVGDGEIGFEGGAGVDSVINALQGAAVNGNGQVAQRPANAEGAVQASVLSEPASLPIPGTSKELDPRLKRDVESPIAKRDLSGFDRALRFAEVALEKGPKIQLGTGADGAGVGIIVDNNQEAAARPGTGVAE